MKQRKRPTKDNSSRAKKGHLSACPADALTNTDEMLDSELDMEFGGGEATLVNAQNGTKVRRGGSIRSMLSIQNLILVVCVAVFTVCCIILIGRFFDYRRGDEIYKSLSDSIFREVSDDPSVISGLDIQSPQATLNNYSTTLSLGVSEGEIPENTTVIGDIHYARIRAKLEELRKTNEDIIGWIKIEGTQINYPVALGSDNEYYLTHAYNGEYLRSGTIFADYKNNVPLSENYNTVLYGHNMANGAMFAGVKKFLNEELFNTAMIYFYTMDGVYVYEPVMLLETVASFYYFRVNFSSKRQYKLFLDQMYESAKLKKDVELTADDKLLSLSTCSNRVASGRYCLQARLVRIENQR